MVAYSFPRVEVVVQNFSGKQLEVSVEAGSSVLGLKHKVAQMWQVPPLCQNVALGTKVLRDLDVFADLRGEVSNEPISLTMVVSLQHLYEQIESRRHELREAAVEALAYVAHRDYERASTSLARCARDRITAVRLAAVETLAKVAQKGDQAVLEALRACHSDRSRDVRLAALEAIARTACWEHPATMGVVSPYLSVPDPDTRQAAVELIRDVSTVGYFWAVACIDALDDRSSEVRRAAAETLGSMAPVRERNATEVQHKVLTALAWAAIKDPDADVRRAASIAETRLTPKAIVDGEE